jgi:hypothetical protein
MVWRRCRWRRDQALRQVFEWVDGVGAALVIDGQPSQQVLSGCMDQCKPATKDQVCDRLWIKASLRQRTRSVTGYGSRQACDKGPGL